MSALKDKNTFTKINKAEFGDREEEERMFQARKLHIGSEEVRERLKHWGRGSSLI